MAKTIKIKEEIANNSPNTVFYLLKEEFDAWSNGGLIYISERKVPKIIIVDENDKMLSEHEFDEYASVKARGSFFITHDSGWCIVELTSNLPHGDCENTGPRPRIMKPRKFPSYLKIIGD